MKQLIFVIILALFLSFCGSGEKNASKPVHGEWDFKLKKDWEINQLGESFFERIREIRVGKDGKVFLLDSKRSKVLVCNSQGTFLYDFGGKGEGPGELMVGYSTRMFIKDKYVIIHEMSGGRIHYFLHDGTIEQTKKVLKYSGALKTYLAPDRFVFFNNVLGIYNMETGDLKEIAELPEDKPLHIPVGNDLITLVGPDVAVTTICAQFEGEKIFYGRNDEYVITGVDLKTNETITLSIPGRKGRIISESTKKKRFELYFKDKKSLKMLIAKCPDRTNFFNRIMIDKMGLIYVFVPNWEQKDSFEIDIFSQKGEYLYHSVIEIPDEYTRPRNLTFSGGALYLTARDKEGENKFVKFHISPVRI